MARPVEPALSAVVAARALGDGGFGRAHEQREDPLACGWGQFRRVSHPAMEETLVGQHVGCASASFAGGLVSDSIDEENALDAVQETIDSI